MEKFLYVRDVNMLKSPQSLLRYSGVYFGNEFCEQLIPSLDEISIVLDIVKRRKKKFVFVTPYCSGEGVAKLENVFDILPKGTEVVCSDFGVLHMIKNFGLQPVLGRLLVSVKRDVRIEKNDKKNMPYFQTCNLESKAFIKFLKGNGVNRVELDNVKQGYHCMLPLSMHATLHLPYVYITTSRKCAAARCANPKSGNFNSYTSCGFECVKQQVTAELPKATSLLVLKGNSIFYENKRIPLNAKELNVDRMVVAPQLPFAIGDSEIWNYYYCNHQTDACWGTTETDNHVIDFVRHYHEEIQAGDTILDVGCGHGKNTKFFLKQGLKTFGIDIAPWAVLHCKKNFPQGKFQHMDVEQMPWANFFDILCDAGCMHSTHPVKHKNIIEKYHLALKRNGLMFIRIFHSDHGCKKPLFYVDTLPIYGYRKKEILNLFDQKKFSIEHMVFNQDQGTQGIYYIYLRKK